MNVPICLACSCSHRFQKLHAFYDRLCPKCADLNFTKRNQVADLRGYTAIVTGGRVKIGELQTHTQTCIQSLPNPILYLGIPCALVKLME
jgi:hypothetical protein